MTEPWGLVDELVVAVGGRDEQVLAVIAAAGPERVAALLAAEVGVRCVPTAGVEGAAVALRIAEGDTMFRYGVHLTADGAAVEPGEPPGALAAIRYTMLDLVRLVYATRPGYRTTSREVEVLVWPWEGEYGIIDSGGDDADGFLHRTMARLKPNNLRLSRSVNAVIDACSAKPIPLTDLSVIHGSDKWASLHWYMPHYERYLGEMRHDPVRILEIGVGGYGDPEFGGESLFTWQRFFPRGLMVGIDLFEKPHVTGPRIRTAVADQTDLAALQEIAERFGPFDVVIDDGSHENTHVRTSYVALFPHVRPGGYYIIEDVQTSYWPSMGGAEPPGSSATTIGWVKDLVDRIHFREHSHVDADTARAAEHPSDVFVHHNLVVLAKGVNHEQGSPSFAQDTLSVVQGDG